MKCPMCEGEVGTRVMRTVDQEGRVVRERRCVSEHKHRLQTNEEFVGWRLQDARVLTSGGRQPGGKPGGEVTCKFELERLADDLGKSTSGKLSASEVSQIVDGVMAGLRRRINSGDVKFGITDESRKGLARGSKYPMLDAAIIREETEKRLLDGGHTIAHLLYALTFRGDAWKTAEEVLKWLYGESAYPDLHQTIPARPTVYGYEWAPRRNGQDPISVAKPGIPGAVMKDFDLARFQKSITEVMLGRGNAQKHSEYISWTVLRPLSGQSIVTASQLSSGVAATLRQLDDIAYLRWVTVMKGITNVDDFHDEAVNLVKLPSAALQFGSEVAAPLDLKPLEDNPYDDHHFPDAEELGSAAARGQQMKA